MAVSEQEVRHLAKLSALEMTDEEIVRMSEDLGKIVEYVGQLQQVNTEGVEPLLQPIENIVSPLYTETIPYSEPETLLSNTKHQVLHNHVVITSNKGEENS